MAAVTLSQVRAWDVTHLHDAATHWDAVATTWEHAFDSVHQESFAPGGTEWMGAAADAAQLQTAIDRKTASTSADALRSTATIARSGADELTSAKANVLDAVANAQSHGFVVAEDFSVTDPRKYPPPVAAARQTQAAGHGANIAGLVTTLTATDQRVAGSMSEGIFAADFPLDVPTPSPTPPTPQSQPSHHDPITDMLVPPPATGPPAAPTPVGDFYDQLIQQLAQRPPQDPMVLEALRQAYAANHQACNSWQWAGGILGFGGSTAGLLASIPELIPPITPVGVAGGAASLAGMGAAGAAVIDCATR
jgi:hypothetical protein